MVLYFSKHIITSSFTWVLLTHGTRTHQEKKETARTQLAWITSTLSGRMISHGILTLSIDTVLETA